MAEHRSVRYLRLSIALHLLILLTCQPLEQSQAEQVSGRSPSPHKRGTQALFQPIINLACLGDLMIAWLKKSFQVPRSTQGGLSPVQKQDLILSVGSLAIANS